MAATVLVTGATGFIGFKTLLDTLAAGYKVRAAVRSEEKALNLKSRKAVQKYASTLSTVVVPDIVADGAYDEAVKGVDYVIHLASPVLLTSSVDYPKDFFDPAVKGTVNILIAAKKESKVKRVVITASIYSLTGGNYDVDTKRVYTADDAPPKVDPAGKFVDWLDAYAASKTLSWEAALNWMAANKPSFDLINILPGYVFGRDESATKAGDLFTTTNGMLLGPILGKSNPNPIWTVAVSVGDVARMHVQALQPSVKGNESYLATTKKVFYNEALDVVKKAFPDAVASGLLPANGDQPSGPMQTDNSKSETAFGFTFKTIEEITKDLVGQYIELASASA